MSNNEIFSYRRLVVYQHCRKYVRDIYILMKKFPVEERYALCDQLRRASVSITSNIAEGMGRFSDKEKVHFIEVAYGSLYETMSQLEIALDLDYINLEDFTKIENEVVNIAKMMSGLRKSLDKAC